jgi:predicted ester cyclase
MFTAIRQITITIIAIWANLRLSMALIPSAVAITAFVKRKRKQGEAKAPESPVVKFWLDSLNHGEVDEVEDFITPDFVWYANDVEVQRSSPDEDVYQLHRGDVAFIRTLIPDVQVSLKDEVIGEDDIAVRCSIKGTHTGAVPGIPPSGNEVAWDQVAFFYTATGKLVELSTEFDSDHWLAQLGVVASG